MGEYVDYFRRFIAGLPKSQYLTIEEMQKAREKEEGGAKAKIGSSVERMKIDS